KELQKKLNVPIGLVLSARGATTIESWMSGEVLRNDVDFENKYNELTSFTEESFKNKRVYEISKSLEGKMPKIVSSSKGLEKWDKVWKPSSWLQIDVPGFWENKGFAGIDGVAWYKKIVEANFLTDSASLYLGRVMDEDQVWINSVELK